MKIFSGNANPALAKDIAAYLGINLGRVKVSIWHVRAWDEHDGWCIVP